MFAIIDQRAPEEVKNNLKKYTETIFEFSTNGITSEAISGHPDIFIFQSETAFILAPNIPESLVTFFEKANVHFTYGTKPVGKNLDESVLYNAICTSDKLYGHTRKLDKSILEHCANKKIIHVNQAFTRCSMFVVKNRVITSDKGIVKILKTKNIDYCYFDPSDIQIVGHKNGFIGGCMGQMENKIFFMGNLLKHKDGGKLQDFLELLDFEVISLGHDYLYDGGGLFFM